MAAAKKAAAKKTAAKKSSSKKVDASTKAETPTPGAKPWEQHLHPGVSSGATLPPEAPPPAGTPAEVTNEMSDKLWAWQLLRQRIATDCKPLLDAEMAARKELVAAFFPWGMREGVNTLDLGEGYQFKVNHQVKREVDREQLDAVCLQLPEGTRDWVIRWKPELELTRYREMPAEYRTVFDACITTKPQSPQAQVVTPKGTEPGEE